MKYLEILSLRKKYLSTRTIVQEALSRQKLKFSSDWTVYQGKIITFHDLYNEDLPLAKVVDKGTIDELTPQKFYKIDRNHENVFKTLLKFCLQQMLYHKRVLWQHDEALFFFVSLNNQSDRKICWQGKKWTERTVLEAIRNKKTDTIVCYKHLAFKVQFKQFGEIWYLLIKPEWFFSVDEYRISRYHADKIEWLKAHERNEQVFNHLRFITYFLKQEEGDSLFRESSAFSFLSFGELANFSSAPFLDDEEWNSKDEKSKEMLNQQGSLFDL